MSQQGGSWRDLVAAARGKAEELSADPRAQQAIAKAREGASVAGRHLDKTRRKVTQEEAWAEVTETLQDVVDVLIVQQRLIEGLSAELSRLKGDSIEDSND